MSVFSRSSIRVVPKRIDMRTGVSASNPGVEGPGVSSRSGVVEAIGSIDSAIRG
jgi:hypothetical protein